MKILSPSQIQDTDKYTIIHEPISSIDLMERASTKCFEWFIEKYNPNNTVAIFCGIGNNGGDGLALSRMLIDVGWKVKTYVVDFSNNYSLDFTTNYKRLEIISPIRHIVDIDTIPNIEADIVVDAIFGVGLSRSPSGFTKELIETLNNSEVSIVSIDMPSGLYADKEVLDNSTVVRANFTLTFQALKLSLLLPEYYKFYGELSVLDIGLHKGYIDQLETHHYLIESKDVLINKRGKFSHKGTYGHSLLVGGSKGKIGSMVLSTKAAVKSGSGLVTSLIPSVGYDILQISVPEAMVVVEEDFKFDTDIKNINPSSIGIGPGLGITDKSYVILKKFLNSNIAPLVLDADAINLLSSNKELLNSIPEGTILTPHPKEFERLVGKWSNDFEKLRLASEFSMNYQVVLVLKGYNTAIFVPDGNIYFNSTGNSALATGGSGDVLTGIITSLVSQGYTNVESCILGVYLHGLTSDIAILGDESEQSFSASSIIANLGKAFNIINK